MPFLKLSGVYVIENVNIVCIQSSSKNLVISGKVNRYYVSSIYNSSYSYMAISLKLHMCLRRGLQMCILFGYNP